jgi:hypothetical protein
MSEHTSIIGTNGAPSRLRRPQVRSNVKTPCSWYMVYQLWLLLWRMQVLRQNEEFLGPQWEQGWPETDIWHQTTSSKTKSKVHNYDDYFIWLHILQFCDALHPLASVGLAWNQTWPSGLHYIHTWFSICWKRPGWHDALNLFPHSLPHTNMRLKTINQYVVKIIHWQ